MNALTELKIEGAFYATMNTQSERARVGQEKDVFLFILALTSHEYLISSKIVNPTNNIQFFVQGCKRVLSLHILIWSCSDQSSNLN